MSFQSASPSRRFAAQLFQKPEAQLAFIRAVWPIAVGGALAERSEVVALQGRTARIRVADASWRREIHGSQRTILGRLKGLAGDLAPNRLGIMEGPIAAPATPRIPASVEPVEPSADLVAAAGEIEDETLRSDFLEVAARYQSRFSGS